MFAGHAHSRRGFGAKAPTLPGRVSLLLLALAAVVCGCKGKNQGPTGPETTTTPLSVLALFPDRYASVVGEIISLEVSGRDTAGSDVPGIVPLYTSSNSNVVSIDPSGRITASGVGTATVQAAAGGRTAETTVYVGAATYDLNAL